MRRLTPGASSFLRYRSSRPWMVSPREVFGISFRNPLGLSGMDHSGEYFNQLSDYGFGYVAIGPFSARDNREGILSAVKSIRSAPLRTILAASLSRDSVHTTDEEIMEDYLIPFTLLYDFVDMVIVDMYAPEIESINEILDELLSMRLCYENAIPIVLRIPRRLQGEELEQTLDFVMMSGIDGVILSGEDGVETARTLTKGRLPIIGSPVKKTPQEAAALLTAGASLIDIDGLSTEHFTKFPRKVMKTLSENSKQR